MPSGKQILIDFLSRLAITGHGDRHTEDVSEELRACLLLRGSTAEEAWPMVETMCWASEHIDDEVVRQGVAIQAQGLFLADLLETIIAPESIPQHVADAYPTLSQQEYSYATDCIWLILSSLQWFREQSSIDGDDTAERERLISSLRSKLAAYHDDPDGFLNREKA